MFDDLFRSKFDTGRSLPQTQINRPYKLPRKTVQPRIGPLSCSLT